VIEVRSNSKLISSGMSGNYHDVVFFCAVAVAE
jgi:hypothetical protein